MDRPANVKKGDKFKVVAAYCNGSHYKNGDVVTYRTDYQWKGFHAEGIEVYINWSEVTPERDSMTFKHGDKVTCTIDGVKITDAKISMAAGGKPFICQNMKDGDGASDKLGYKYSWILREDFTQNDVTDLKLLQKTLNDLQVGDVLVDADDDGATVLGVCGRVVFVSKWNEPTKHSCGYTVEELEEKGMKIKEAKPEVTEVTMDEVAKKFGCSVESFKIKKE